MVDLEAARAWAARVRSTDTASDDVTADYIERMAMELEAHRAASPISAPGPSMAERLERCRDRASRIVAAEIVAGFEPDDRVGSVESLAHAMLAAEREPEAVTRG